MLRGGVVGAVAGFLIRPCCVIPAVLSATGVTSAGAADAVVTHRYPLLLLSGLMLATSLWITFRRDGAWVSKVLTVVATIIAFAFSARVIGGLS